MTPLNQLVDLAMSQDMAWHAGQESLTTSLLRPILPEIVDTLGRLRLRTDAWIAQSAAPPSYPIGFCAVIRDRVFDGLLGDPRVQSLIAAGLVLKKVFVILKDRYFQNAMQFGNLYIDVANDTVDPAKPWLEWMDVREVPYENVGELPTLIRVAESYHRCHAFPNVFFPLLAPVVPLLLIAEDGRLGLLHFQDGGFLKDLAHGVPHLRSWLAGPARLLPPLPEPYTVRVSAVFVRRDRRAGRRLCGRLRRFRSARRHSRRPQPRASGHPLAPHDGPALRAVLNRRAAVRSTGGPRRARPAVGRRVFRRPGRGRACRPPCRRRLSQGP